MRTISVCLLMVTFLMGSIINTTATSNRNNSVAIQPQMPSAEEMAKHDTEWMKAELSLSAEQLTSVSDINLKYAKKAKELFDQSNGDREGMHSKMEALQSQKKEELAKILSAEQLQKYVTYQASHQRGPRKE